MNDSTKKKSRKLCRIYERRAAPHNSPIKVGSKPWKTSNNEVDDCSRFKKNSNQNEFAYYKKIIPVIQYDEMRVILQPLFHK